MRFQQRGLHFGGGAVDFIGQQHVGEHRTGHEGEAPLARGGIILNHIRARDIAGHQVRRELNAREPEVERTRQCGDEQRFRETRYAHQQTVAAGEERD